MELSFAEAIASLRTTIESMLPPLPPSESASVSIYPTQLKPTGLGGFVASHDTVNGDIIGCQIEAEIRLLVQANQPDPLRSAVDTVVLELGGRSRQQLVQQGLLRFRLKAVGGITPLEASGSTSLTQAVSYHTLYEFLKIPEESAEIIQSVPLIVEVA